jgi:hypothetical protein
MKVPNMIEKTLRYPGHGEHIRALRDSGFFDTDEIDVRGRKIRPLRRLTLRRGSTSMVTSPRPSFSGNGFSTRKTTSSRS